MEKQKTQNKFLTALIILMGTAMFYLNEQGVSLGSFTLMIKIVIGLGIIGVGALAFLIRPDLKHMRWVIKDSLVLSLPYLTTVFFSMMLWMLNNCSFSDITRGISDPLYQLIGIVASAAYVAMFREKAILVQFISMALANALVIVQNYIRVYGLATFIKEFIALAATFGGADGHMVAIEVHDLTFAIGLYLLYCILKRGKVKYRWFIILAAGFFFTAGLKRIAAGALVAIVILMIIYQLLPENGKRVYLQLGGIILIFSSILYIWAIKNGLYTVLAERFNINTMGRIEMNEFIDSYYTFSPLYRGYGLGYVSKLLLSGAASRVGVFLGIHNDLLRIYIETGFWGYIGWLVTFWGYMPWYFMRKRGPETGKIAFALILYCFITYLTDNTYYYYYMNIAAYTLILSCEYSQAAEETEVESESEDQEELLWKKY